jgi:zinc protease
MLSKKYMEGTGRVITLSYQQKDGVTAPTEDQVEDMLSKVEKSTLKAYEDKVSNEPLLAQKPKPGKIISEKKIADLGITEWTLSNGVPVVLKPTDFKNDQILFSGFKPGGYSLASDADYLSAEAAATLVDMGGVAKFDATVLDKMLSGKNVSMNPTMTALQEGFSGSSPPKDEETMFQLLYLYGTQPRKDPQAFESYYQRRAAQLKSRDAAPEAAYADTLQVTMAQYNYRARPMKLSMLNEITLDKAYQFYKDRFTDYNGFTFFIVGNIDMPQVRNFVETYIASLPSSNQKESWKDIGISPPKGVITKSVYKGIAPKSSVTINITGPFEWNTKNRFDM